MTRILRLYLFAVHDPVFPFKWCMNYKSRNVFSIKIWIFLFYTSNNQSKNRIGRVWGRSHKKVKNYMLRDIDTSEILFQK